MSKSEDDMNTRNLPKTLEYIGLSATTIAVGGVAEDHYCVMKTDDEQWEVFFYERGVKGRIVVAMEDIACTYLFGLLAHSQVLSEKLVPAE